MTTPEAAQSLLSLSHSFADAIAQVGQSVVAVKASRRNFASGVHWRSGFVVTTDHSLRQEDEVTLTLPDQSTITATLVGRDTGTDLAILKIPENLIPVAPIDDRTSLQAGHLVLSVGRSSETGVTASMGIISTIGGSWRTWHGGQIDQLIRPNLLLYPGSSGSALITPQAQVLGINTTAPRSSALTIPVATVNRVIDQLLQKGRIVRGYLGVGMQPVQLPDRLRQSLGWAGQGGVLIVSIEADSPADRAGVLIGDVVISLDNVPIDDIPDVHRMLDPDRVGQPLTAQVIRGGQQVELTIVVGERPRRADS